MDDDLAQAVDLGEALLEGGDYVGEFAKRLVVWSAGERTRHWNNDKIVSLARWRPGIDHPTRPASFTNEDPIAPNGGVMRCAPVALARFRQPELLVGDSAATCVVTHYAPTSQWSCIIINAAIALAAKRGTEPDLSALMAAASADGCPDLLGTALSDGIPSDVLECIADDNPVTEDCSWLRRDQRLIGHTLIALQAGLWSAVTPLDFETALRQVVEAGGDTDTNGAVAGAVLGARYGASAIPRRWLDVIPQRERVEGLADGLVTLGD